MIIKCVECKIKFEQKIEERLCTKCKPSIKKQKMDKYNSKRSLFRQTITENNKILINLTKPQLCSYSVFSDYVHHLHRHFQNPIQQWYKEFINNEQMTSGKPLKRIAKSSHWHKFTTSQEYVIMKGII